MSIRREMTTDGKSLMGGFCVRLTILKKKKTAKQTKVGYYNILEKFIWISYRRGRVDEMTVSKVS